MPPAKPTATHTASRSAASVAMSHSTSHSTCESYECLLSRSTLSVRLGGSEHVPKLRALKPGLLVLPTLPGPLAAALHVCHSSLCRQSSAPSRAQPCRALRKCGETARPEHWSCHTTGAPRERTLPGTRLHLREHARARCHPRPPAAPSRQTTLNAAARVLRELSLAGGPPCRAGVS